MLKKFTQDIIGFCSSNKFIKYAFVGGLATLVDWLSFYAVNNILGANYIIALIISFALGSTTNYFLNKAFTFKSKTKKISKQLPVHLTISAVSLFVNMGMMYVIISLIGLTPMTGRVITTIIMLVVNFFLHKNITFNDKYFGEEDYV